MKLADLPSSMADWSTVPSSEHPGECGRATVRSRQFGEVQLRMVEYSASYLGDRARASSALPVRDEQDSNESRRSAPIALVHESIASVLAGSGLHALVRRFENEQVSVRSDRSGFDESPRFPFHATEGAAHRN